MDTRYSRRVLSSRRVVAMGAHQDVSVVAATAAATSLAAETAGTKKATAGRVEKSLESVLSVRLSIRPPFSRPAGRPARRRSRPQPSSFPEASSYFTKAFTRCRPAPTAQSISRLSAARSQIAARRCVFGILKYPVYLYRGLSACTVYAGLLGTLRSRHRHIRISSTRLYGVPYILLQKPRQNAVIVSARTTVYSLYYKFLPYVFYCNIRIYGTHC